MSESVEQMDPNGSMSAPSAMTGDGAVVGGGVRAGNVGVIANNTAASSGVSGASGVGGGVASGGVNNIDTSTGPGGVPAVEVKLFIGRVPGNMDENALKPVFEEYGAVKEAVIIRDKATGKHKNSAFVKLASLACADAAIRGLNNLRVLDQGMGAMTVRYATGEVDRLKLSPIACEEGVDQVKMFVGSIPRNMVDDELRAFFERYGGVEETFVMRDNINNTGRGCAFVKMAYKEQALHAINQLNGKHTFPGCNRPAEVRFAESRAQRQQAMMAGGAGAVNMRGNNRMGPMAGAPMGAPMGGPMGGGMGGGGMPGNNSNPRSAGAWKEYFTQDNRPYYHNEMTGVTTWDRPQEFIQPAPPAGGGFGGGDGDGRDQNGPPGANIFIFHVPNDWTQMDLVTTFQQFGPIVSARVATDRITGRNKGFAFVSYEHPDSAAHAVNNMNGFMAAGKRLKVTIKKGEEQYASRVSPQSMNQPMGGARSDGAGWGVGGGGGVGNVASGYAQQQQMTQQSTTGYGQQTGQPMSAYGQQQQYQQNTGYAQQPAAAQQRFAPY